jgi:hypothetical protein
MTDADRVAYIQVAAFPEFPQSRNARLPLVDRPRFTLVLRVELLVIFALSLSILGLALAGVASKPTWHNVVFPPIHGASTLPMITTLSDSVPGWVLFVLVGGLSTFWAGCVWVLLRHGKAGAID